MHPACQCMQGVFDGPPAAHAQVDQWLQFAPHLVTGGGLAPACMTVNEALSLRTFLVGYSLTIADIAVWAQLQSACPLLGVSHLLHMQW